MTREVNEPSREERVNDIIAEYLRAADAGQAPGRDDLLARHADLADELRAFFADDDAAARLAPPPAAPPSEAPTLAPGALAAPAVGTTVRYFGDYELLEEIARGGMGVVYKARQISLNRVVALKMILSGQFAGAEDVQRFRLEAQTAAGLQHPNVVAIHEVGEHAGQHYFSMDFVEGRSLADLVRDNPLPPEQATRWVRTIAEAIQYAHERGVLHRDLKPSNVLIDGFGQPRVTDFGLAKRIDKDAGLTATGAVVGTPSYMPPEQASGQRGQIGPASDVYSLGAVLYELVTGRPPFRAATPLDTLLQVLEAEPAPPRLLNPAVGRDLETIILKCLAKEPARRYATARELADDLGALLEGRPIKARRPGLAERALLWAQTQRRSAVLIVLTAAASALLLLGGTLGWDWYAESRLGRLLINTGGPPFRVEVLDDEGHTVVKPFQTITPGPVEIDPVPLPAGDFDLCLSAPGARGETYRLLVQRGWKYNFGLSPESRQPWEPLRIKKAGDFAEVIDVGGRADIVLVTDTRLRRLSGADREPVQEWGEERPVESPVVRDRGFDWNQVLRARRPWLVRPAPVVEGDRLVVWASRSSASLLAVSGKTGRLLWWHRAFPSLPRGTTEEQVDRLGPFFNRFNNLPSGQVIAEPLVAECEGRPLIVATFASGGEDYWIKAGAGGVGRAAPEDWVEAIDARTGERVWRHSLGAGGANYAAGLLTVEGRPVVALVADRRLLALDLGSGEAVSSHDLEPLVGHSADYGERTVPQFGMFGSPARAGILLAWKDPFEGNSSSTNSRRTLHVAAVSLKTGQALWQMGMVAHRDASLRKDLNMYHVLDGPLVVDLDGDGGPGVVLAYPEPTGPRPSDRAAVEVLDGATGARRWLYQFPVAELSPMRVTVGPDLDGDGRREVFVASHYRPRHGGEGRLFVEALSGQDGRPLWRWSHPFRGGDSLDPLSRWSPGALSWWDQPGADGWPQLLVPVVRRDAPTTGPTFVLSAGTGRLSQVLAGLPDARQADLDGDGISDLWAFRADAGASPEGPPPGGVLSALRGAHPEAWRRLGHWLPVGDLDGDGVPDVVNAPGTASGTVAVSGKDGRILWQSDASPQTVLPLPLPYGDLDGDGTPDLLLFHAIEGLSAVSGKNGRRIWKAEFELYFARFPHTRTPKTAEKMRGPSNNGPFGGFGKPAQKAANP